MRKIETQMNQAVANNKSWQSGNTSVSFNEETGESIVRLHGNKIAVIGDDFLQIFDGGWQTNTTKSRLNALIERFCNAVTDGVFQKDFQWYISDNNVTRDFDNGYIFSWRNHGEVSNTLLSLITSFFLIIMLSTFASMSSFEFAIAEIQNDLKVTRLAPVKPKKSLLTMTQTKGNRCRTNRTSGTNFVKQVWLITFTN